MTLTRYQRNRPIGVTGPSPQRQERLLQGTGCMHHTGLVPDRLAGLADHEAVIAPLPLTRAREDPIELRRRVGMR